MGISKSQARWDGGLRNGKGMMKPANGAEATFGMSTRFEGKPGSNPEEMLGAALAGCFSMALSAALEKAGTPARSVATSADVHLDKEGDGFSITRIDLRTEVSATGVDGAKVQSIAETTKKNCPVGKALAGTTITLQTTLRSDASRDTASP